MKQLWHRVSAYLTAKPYLRTLLVFSFFFLVFLWMYFSVDSLVSGDDHFFLFRFAQLMRQHGFLASFQNFKTLYFSKMAQGQYFVFYYFLFFLVIIPFTFIQPLFLAIKLYAVVAAALAFTVLYLCFRWYGLKKPFVWTLAIFGLTGHLSILRLFLSRPYVLAPILLLILLFALDRRKYVGVFFISFLYLYWHSVTFFFSLFVAVTYYVFERFYGKKGDWKNVAACVGGILIAVGSLYLFAPGFLLYMKDIAYGIFWDTIIHKKVFIPEGNEVYPVNFFNYISSNTLIFICFVVATSLEIYHYLAFRFGANPDLDPRIYLRITTFFLSLSFFLGTIIVSTRFNDFFIFFVGFYLAASLETFFRHTIINNQAMRHGALVGLLIVVVYLFVNNVISLQQTIANNGAPVEVFAGVGNWLKVNTKKGDVVFNPDWSWFPQLYYYSPDNYYIEGLDPRFIYVSSPSLYWKWLNIGYKGYVCDQESCPDLEETRRTLFRNGTTTTERWNQVNGDDVAKSLLNDFHSSSVVSSNDFPLFNAVMDHNRHFEKVHGKDKAYFIYKVKS